MPETIAIVGEPTDYETLNRAVGIVFAVAYGLFLLLTLWRTWRYTRSSKVPWRRCIKCHTKKDVLKDKMLAVHILLALFALFDIGFGSGFIIVERPDYRAHVIHLLALLCFYSAFCLLPLILNESLEFGGAYYYIRLFCRVAVIAIALEIFLTMALQLQYEDLQGGTDWNNVLLLTLTTGVLLTLALWMLFYAVRLFLFFSTSGSMNMPGYLRSERFRAIIKMLSIMIVFSLCAMIRAVCTVLLILEQFYIYHIYKDFSFMGWIMVSQWIPFLTSGYLMLFVCTPDKRTRAPSRSQYTDGTSRTRTNQSATRTVEESPEDDDSPFTGKRTVVLSGGDEESRGSETANPVIEMSAFGNESSMASSFEVPGPMY